MSKELHIDVGERRAAQNAGRSLRAVLVSVAVFYIAGGLLNGTYLYKGAEDREFGETRDLWMKATKPLSDASEFLNLHLFRDQVEKLRKE